MNHPVFKNFLSIVLLTTLCSVVLATDEKLGDSMDRPNVVLIMTDDQGIGDFGCMGNPWVQTPNVDKMFERSARFTHFYVCPVCSPTRASLMTGRYNYRTRAIDTYVGRSMMEPEELTIAERFKRANYETGIFGKWHLGDCYPMRPHDQGFDRAVVHRGGGIGQTSDPIGALRAYTNPILQHNGESVQETGYCTDVYYDHAISFIEKQVKESKPFFVYLPDNCPHGPFSDLPEDWWNKFKNQDLRNENFPGSKVGFPVANSQPKRNGDRNDQTNRVFAMVGNIDENIGRLQAKLKQLGIVDNTIVIFMTDNGPNGERYTCGLRGRKTSVYEGGIRTLFLMQWPERIKTKMALPQMAAHIDITPTLIEACGLPVEPSDPKLDGVSLLGLVEGQKTDWKQNRSHLFFQVHRGNVPQRYHHFAVRDHQFKLVHHSGFGMESFQGEPKFELFDLIDDPYEMNDLAAEQPERVESLKSAYDRWFDDVSSTRENNYAPPRIVVDPSQENPLWLTMQDVRRDSTVDAKDWPSRSRWLMKSPRQVSADLTIHFRKNVSGVVRVNLGDETQQVTIDNAKMVKCKVKLPQGEFSVGAYLKTESGLPKATDGKENVFQLEFSF